MKTSTSLRWALTSNALFSGATGAYFLLFNTDVSEWMNIHPPIILFILGIALLCFAAFVFITALRKDPSPPLVISIVVQDILWVVGSLVLLVIQPFPISALGNVAIGLVAGLVGIFAAWQGMAFWRMRVTPSFSDDEAGENS